MISVLLVEDEPLNRLVAQEVLLDMACDVTMAHVGAQALLAATQGAFDVILMDVRMPVLDGLKSTRLIAHAENALGRRPTPVVAVTAGATARELQHCLEAGMVDVLVKPYQLEDLQDKVVRWGGPAGIQGRT